MTAHVRPTSFDDALWWNGVSTTPDELPIGSGADTAATSAATAPLGQPSAVAASAAKPLQRSNTIANTGGGSISAVRGAIAVACVACRSRHLKCDGGTRCSRCIAEGLQCSYVKSRRGWKGPRRLTRVPAPVQDTANGTAVGPRVATLPPALHEPLTSPLLERRAVQSVLSPDPILSPVDFLRSPDNHGKLITLPHTSLSPAVDTSGNGLITAFYIFFHPPHPFLVPHFHMLELLQRTRIRHLELALQYLGSFYAPAANTTQYHDSLVQALAQDNVPRDGTLVQSLLLFAIGLHISDKEEESAKMLQTAIQLALELGMNRREYASAHGAGHALLEESWMRTWWELLVIDGMMSGVNPIYKMALAGVTYDVPLPCDDDEFRAGRIPVVRRFIEDYDDALFVGEPYVFSSGTYRIDAVRILQKVMSASATQPPDQQALEMVDTHLTNWSLHLPDEKRKPMDRDGQVDEVLFVAHMIINACSILLHRPRSDLSYEDVKDVTTCVAGGESPFPGLYKDLHTAKAMQAARDISKLARMPCPLVQHTPFFTCAVTMAAVVYLSYWSFIATESGDAAIKEHIRLNIGVLKALAAIWPVARTVLGQVRAVAQELFASRRALNNAYWNAVTREEILQGMIEGTSDDAAPLPGPALEEFVILPP